MTAVDILEAIRSGELAAGEAAASAAESISRRDPCGAFLSTSDPDDPPPGGSLGGVPYAAKDNMSTANLPTTCASRMLEDYTPVYDATCIELMESSGAILVGKTNMDEFAMGSSNETSYFGPTRNPWNHGVVPGGSSGGSAAAVAAGMVPLALGTDTGGSIRQPASFCGITGMKPTYGAISRRGVISFASSMDQVGPMALTAGDCALALDVLVARDPGDSTSVEHPEGGGFFRRVRGSSADLSGIRIGMPKEYYGVGIDEPVTEIALRAARVFEDLGATIEEISLPHTEYALPAYYVISSAEASSNLARYDGISYGMREIGDDIDDLYRNTRSRGFGEEVKRRIMLGSFALSAGYYDAFYLRAARVRRVIAEEIDRAFRRYDYLLTPTCPTVAFPLGERVEDPMAMYMADVCTIPANLAGIPALSMPGGFSGGLPVGVQLMGPRFSDGGLLSLADVFQRTTDHHLRRPSDGVEGVEP